MSNLLGSYETEFQHLLESTKLDLQKSRSSAGNTGDAAIQSIRDSRDELGELLDQMDIESSTLADSQQRARIKASVRQYRKQVQAEVEGPLHALVEQRERDQLFGSNSNAEGNNYDGSAGVGLDNATGMDEDQREQLLKNHRLLNKTGSRLQEASKIATDTEQVGSQIMDDLRAQRETLENSRQTLFQADSYVDKSIRTLRTMSRRLVANKFISYAIIAVLVLLILLVLYTKFK